MTTKFLRAVVSVLVAIAGLGTVPAGARAPNEAFNTARLYVEEFYPLWFTYYQSQYATTNHLIGPNKISPAYQIVVAINDDTLYASTFLDVSSQPVMLTVPSTSVHYSVLVLDPYGDVFDSGISTTSPGLYALTGPGFEGPLPKKAIQIKLPLHHMVIIFRADKYSAAGVDQEKKAALFRKSLRLQVLSDWWSNPAGGGTGILPEVFFGVPFKAAADAEIAAAPLTFLKQLETAVSSAKTPPLSALQAGLIIKLKALIGAKPSDLAAGVQAAHAQILASYLSHTDRNNWINFTNIGEWAAEQATQRSAITEYIQFGNNFATAAYFQAFKDSTGAALDGGKARYILHIPKSELPQAGRFWSFTAYTPETVELIKNSADKYEIARYTPGLTYNADGSLTLYLARKKPAGAPAANWLPVGGKPFNLLLRVYGPEGSVAEGTYIPPAIQKQ